MSSLDKSVHDDISVLFNTDQIKQFVPSSSMSANQTTNAYVRFSIYFAIIYYIYTGYIYILALPVLVYIATMYFKKKTDYFTKKTSSKKKKNQIDQIDQINCDCVAPTNCNPVMNELPPFTTYNEACNIENKEIKKTISKIQGTDMRFEKIINDDNSSHSFYSVPRQIDNDYANFLYPLPKTCKEDTIVCNNTLPFVYNTYGGAGSNKSGNSS
jgi:hypothetical protein